MGPPPPAGLYAAEGVGRGWLDRCPVPPSQTDPPECCAPKVNAGPDTVRRPPPRARGQTSNFGKAQIPKALAERRTPAVSVEL